MDSNRGMDQTEEWIRRLDALEARYKDIAKPIQSIPEMIRIGEVSIQSRRLRADKLLDLIIDTLKNKDVQAYLKTLDAKKLMGTYSSVGIG